MTTISENERRVMRVLAGLSEGHYMPFAPIQKRTGMDRGLVRRTCRSLKRKGLADFLNGLWTEDGEPAGSGYGPTDKGREFMGEDVERPYYD